MHKRHSRGKEEGTVEKEEESGERRVEGGKKKEAGFVMQNDSRSQGQAR